MDQSMRPKTINSFDLIHSSYMWIQTILSCGKHCTTVPAGIVSRLWFCRRSWGFKIYIMWNIVQIWKSYFRTINLDVQETNICLTEFTGSRDYLSWCRLTHGWDSSSWSLGFGDRSVSLFTKPMKEIQRKSTGKLVAWPLIKQAHPQPNQYSNSSRQSWITQSRLCFIEREVFSLRCDALHFGG